MKFPNIVMNTGAGIVILTSFIYINGYNMNKRLAQINLIREQEKQMKCQNVKSMKQSRRVESLGSPVQSYK
jgi:hypothetical protein